MVQENYPSLTAAPDLLLRPVSKTNEGPLGYFHRLAEANLLMVSDLSAMGIQYDSGCLRQQRLLPVKQEDPATFQHMMRMAGLLRDKPRIWNQRFGRFCPHCLEEAPHWLAAWEVYFFDACPRHGNWLLDRCGENHFPVLWNRPNLLYCQCGAELRKAKTRKAPDSVCRLSAMLESKLLGHDEIEPNSPFRMLDADQIQRLIRYLGAYMGSRAGSRPMKLRCANELDVSWQVTSLAAEIIFDWPRVFHTALSQLQTLSAGEKMGLMGMFRHAYTYIYKGFPEANFAPLREAFESWLAENWKGGLARRNRRLNEDLLKSVRWIPGNIAAAELGVSPARLKFLVKEGMLEGQESVSSTGRSFMVVRRDQLLEIRAKLAEEMPLNEAAERLGLSRARMRQMLRLMFPYARRINDKIYMPWCVPRGEVDALLKLGCDLPVCSDIGDQRVSLGHVFKYWCWSSAEVVALIQSVRSGVLQPVALAPDAVGISRWVFEASDLKAFQENCGVSQTDSLSIPDTAQMLGVKQEVAYWLVRHQFIRSEKAGRFSSARVRREDIEDFHAWHVFGRDLAMLIGKSPKALVLLLEERGIQPLQAGDGEACRQMIYRRDRALSVFLAETGKVSSSDFAGVSITLSESFKLRSPPVNESMPLNL